MERESGLCTPLTLWVGARIIITSNSNVRSGMVNGAIGHVSLITKDSVHVRVGEWMVSTSRETRELAKGGMSRTQYPVQLAYSLTIHSAQGLTLFCSGQTYVAEF
ncbi:hypothetical protein BGZ46_005589, partial [Entomortierella lignicola]